MSGTTADRFSARSQFGAVDWSTGAVPSLLLLLSGASLGPHGLAILTPQVLAFLDPAVPVALSALGVVAGLNLRGGEKGRIIAARDLQAVVTGVLVALCLLVTGPAVMTPEAFSPWWLAAIVLGISAATSSPLPPDPADTSLGLAGRLDIHDYVLPVIAGGLLLAFVREPSPSSAVLLALQATLIAAVIAAAGWLLLSRASTAAEQRVFSFAILLLLGGAADYLSVSALLGGLVAGACWQFASGAVREYVQRDVSYVQDSLLALVFLLAGAHADLSPAALVLSMVYIGVRTAAKLVAVWLAVPRRPLAAARERRAHLIAPGVFGVAFALNVVRAAGPAFAPVLTVVVVGAIASSLLAAFTREIET